MRYGLKSFKQAQAGAATPVVCNEMLPIIVTGTKSPSYRAKSALLPIVSGAVAY
jgi:hypothetical protein